MTDRASTALQIKFWLRYWRVHFRYFLMSWKGLFHSPIVIYSMGKVGSTTLLKTLENLSLPNPIFHVHFLAWDYLKEIGDYRKSLGLGLAEHLIAGRYLRFFADRTWGKVRWKIITLVREPVGRDISGLFENLQKESHLTELSGNQLVDGAIAHMQTKIAGFNEKEDYACNWFDRELKQVFDFDVYDAPFDPKQGYAIYQAPDADILLIRLEDLSTCGTQAVQEFLGISHIEIENANVGREKPYQQIYRAVKQKISFNPADLEKVYNSRYVQHFYTDQEVALLKKRWTTEA